MPLAIVNLNALNRNNPRSAATIKFILQPSMVNLWRKDTSSTSGPHRESLQKVELQNINTYKSFCLLERQGYDGLHKEKFTDIIFQTFTVTMIHFIGFFQLKCIVSTFFFSSKELTDHHQEIAALEDVPLISCFV